MHFFCLAQPWRYETFSVFFEIKKFKHNCFISFHFLYQYWIWATCRSKWTPVYNVWPDLFGMRNQGRVFPELLFHEQFNRSQAHWHFSPELCSFHYPPHCTPKDRRGLKSEIVWKIWICIFDALIKVIYTKYSKHCPYTVAHTFECVCSKINHGLNHGLFISLLKLILCPIHWIVCVFAYLNFRAVLVLPKRAGSAKTHKSISFIWIVWSTLHTYMYISALLINNSVVFCGRKLIPFSQWSIVVPLSLRKQLPHWIRNVPTEYQISWESQYSFSVSIYYPHVRNSMGCKCQCNYLCTFSTVKIKKVRRGGKSPIWSNQWIHTTVKSQVLMRATN